jgi:hypothetical protein
MTPYKEYRKRLFELARRIRMNNSTEAYCDDMRDQMDDYWPDLTREEMARLSKFSANLYKRYGDDHAGQK